MKIENGRTPLGTRLALAAGLSWIAAGTSLASEPPVVEPAAREGSGTGWLPASTPVAGHGVSRGPWDWMLHYNAFAGVSSQDAPENRTEGFTSNWVMGMARYRSAGTLTFRGMLSLEAPFLGDEGYPLVLQTGETSGGVPLVDRQHPHDLFMELALQYARPLGPRVGVEFYLAPVGEPALGPSAFPHRASAATDPMAPLGHHWQDSTHIAFGVATAGVYSKRVKLEGSVFNGRESDENRYDLDFGALDSYSARLTVNPSSNWSVQGSYGYLTEPESLEPDTDVRRFTASIAYHRPLARGHWASTLAWGRNEPVGERASAAILAESSWISGPDAIFGRVEYVQKSGHDFDLEGMDAHSRLPVRALALGYSRRVARRSGVEIAVGGRAAIGFVGETLERRYGSSSPVSGTLFVHLRPAGGTDSPHSHHGM